MKLSEYMKIKDKVERLTQFLNDQGQWQNDYVYHNEDYKNNYDYVLFESEIYHGELDYEVSKMVEYCENIKDTDLIYDNTEIDITNGIYRRSNEIASFNIGEEEIQLTGLYDHDSKINCIYTELKKGMNENEINEAIENCEYYISNDYMYIDFSYDRVSLILDSEKFENEFKQKYKNEYKKITE